MTTATATAERKRRRSGTALDIVTLTAAMSAVKNAVSNRPLNAILNNVLLCDGRLVAANGELRIECYIDYAGEPVLLPYHRTLAILRAARQGQVRITPNGTTCTIEAGTAQWTLPTENADEFPGTGLEDAPALARIPCDQFARAVNAVSYATDTQGTRFALGGICVEVNRGDGTVTFIATDGRRLSSSEIEIGQDTDDAQRLVPVAAMETIRDLCDGHDEEAVQIDSTASELIATLPNARVIARLVEGKFPRWRDVIPEHDTNPTTATIAELRAATSSASICTSEQSKGVEFTFDGDTIALRGQSSEHGTASVTCPVVEPGNECTVKLDPSFVLQFLDGLPADGEPTVSILTKDAAGAVVFRCDDYTGLVMPLGE